MRPSISIRGFARPYVRPSVNIKEKPLRNASYCPPGLVSRFPGKGKKAWLKMYRCKDKTDLCHPLLLYEVAISVVSSAAISFYRAIGPFASQPAKELSRDHDRQE